MIEKIYAYKQKIFSIQHKNFMILNSINIIRISQTKQSIE